MPQSLSQSLPAMFLSALLLLAPGAAAITPGQVDDFEGLTTSGWAIGIEIENPSVPPDGGPAGAGDAFLRYEGFGGGGPASRLVVFNTTQWTGDYAAAGVNGITLDAIALAGSAPLQLRLAIGSSRNAQSGNWFVTTSPVTLTPGEGWRSLSFPLDEARFTQVAGTLDFAQLLTQVGAVRILSSTPTSNQGDQVAGVFGLDNIRAVPVPEPATVFSAGIAAAALSARRRSGRTK